MKQSRREVLKTLVGSYMKKRHYCEMPLSRSADSMAMSGLVDVESSNPNSIMYKCINNDSSIAEAQFLNLKSWIFDLKCLKTSEELKIILFPLLCHLYLEMLSGGHKIEASNFLTKHQSLSSEESLGLLEELATLEHSKDICEKKIISCLRSAKYQVTLSSESIQILKQYLIKKAHIIILQIINSWFDLDDAKSSPLSDLCDDNSTAQANGYDDHKGASSDNDQAKIEEIIRLVNDGSTSPAPLLLYSISNVDESLSCSTVSNDDRLLAAGFTSSNIRLWSLRDEKLEKKHDPSNHIRLAVDLKTQTDCPTECTPTNSRTLDRSIECVQLLGHSSTVQGVAFLPDCEHLVSVSMDRTMRVWNLESYTCGAVYRGHSYPVWCVSASPLSGFVATGSHDRTARLWSLELNFPLRVFAGHLQDVDCITFHPNGNYLSTGSSDNSVRLWSVDTGELVRVFEGHNSGVLALTFSPDGNYIASAGEDKLIKIWDLRNSNILKEFQCHGDSVVDLAWSPNANHLASCSLDNTAKIWSVRKSDQSLQKLYHIANNSICSLQYSRKNIPVCVIGVPAISTECSFNMETCDAGEFINWNHRCRLCFDVKGTRDIFKSNVSENLAYKIKSFLDIVIEPSDTLPNKLCSTCVLRIQSWHDYKIKCLENDTRFKTKLIELNSAYVTHNLPSGSLHLENVLVAVPLSTPPFQYHNELGSSRMELDIPPIKIKTEKIDFDTMDKIQLFNDDICLPEHNGNTITSNSSEENKLLLNAEDMLETKHTPHLNTSEKIIENNTSESWQTVYTVSNTAQNIKMELNESFNCDNNDHNEDKPYHLRPRTSFQYFNNDEFEEITPWKCNACSSYFSSRSVLTAHYNNEECQENLVKYPCVRCKKSFNYKEALARHNLIHMSIDLKISQNDLSCCAICNLRFADLNRCKEHVAKHVAESNSKFQNESNQEFPCSLCVNRFNSEDLLYDHRFAVHGILDERVPCIICTLKFRTQSDLDKHSKVHSSRSVAKKSTGAANRCRQCPESFATKQLLDKHEQSSHYQFKCRTCQRPCASRSALLSHYNTHNSALRNNNLKNDLENEKENPKCCKYCSVEFKFKSDYDVHYSLHIKAGKGFKCDVTCGSLIRFHCSVCPQLFIRESDGLEHCKLIHKGADAKILNLKHPTSRTIENLFLCSICNTELKDDAALSFHIKKIHPEQA